MKGARFSSREEREAADIAAVQAREDHGRLVTDAALSLTPKERRALLSEQASALLRISSTKQGFRVLKDRERRLANAKKALAADKSKRAERERPEVRSVYVIGAVGHPTKIGIAGNVANRLATIQTNCPARLRVYFQIEVAASRAPEIERTAHQRLAAQRLNGEWFDITPAEAIAVVEQIVANLKDIAT